MITLVDGEDDEVQTDTCCVVSRIYWVDPKIRTGNSTQGVKAADDNI